jgi:hypothetical protein
MSHLLTRNQFREAVFARDNHFCVFCPASAVDAHHILERRLWSDGGYYLDNGASVCEKHHRMCESTEILPSIVRLTAGITRTIVPPHLYDDVEYDKWGNVILPDGRRLKGELFFDESVQKVIKPFLDLFVQYVKYPRTHHLPWSQNINNDDRIIPSMEAFKGQPVVVTEKMDGENTTFYRDYIHARSLDGRSHESRDWVKQFRSMIAHDIPEGMRICGENLFAKHSIAYNDLSTYFMGFSMWNEKNICLSWQDTVEWFQLIGITPVPVLYEGIFDEQKIKSLFDPKEWSNKEGYVLRVAGPIKYGEFKTKVAKFVRKDHIQTVKHWMYGQRIEKNLLRG